MKTAFVAGILAIALTGCESTLVEHRYERGGYGYYGYRTYRDPSYAFVVRDGTYYRRGDVERTNVYVNNNYSSNIRRDQVNQTRSYRTSIAANQASHRAPARSASANVQMAATGGHAKALRREKKRATEELTR